MNDIYALIQKTLNQEGAMYIFYIKNKYLAVIPPSNFINSQELAYTIDKYPHLKMKFDEFFKSKALEFNYKDIVCTNITSELWESYDNMYISNLYDTCVGYEEKMETSAVKSLQMLGNHRDQFFSLILLEVINESNINKRIFLPLMYWSDMNKVQFSPNGECFFESGLLDCEFSIYGVECKMGWNKHISTGNEEVIELNIIFNYKGNKKTILKSSSDKINPIPEFEFFYFEVSNEIYKLITNKNNDFEINEYIYYIYSNGNENY